MAATYQPGAHRQSGATFRPLVRALRKCSRLGPLVMPVARSSLRDGFNGVLRALPGEMHYCARCLPGSLMPAPDRAAQITARLDAACRTLTSGPEPQHGADQATIALGFANSPVSMKTWPAMKKQAAASNRQAQPATIDQTAWHFHGQSWCGDRSCRSQRRGRRECSAVAAREDERHSRAQQSTSARQMRLISTVL